jgi:hypothetical protein
MHAIFVGTMHRKEFRVIKRPRKVANSGIALISLCNIVSKYNIPYLFYCHYEQ